MKRIGCCDILLILNFCSVGTIIQEAVMMIMIMRGIQIVKRRLTVLGVYRTELDNSNLCAG